MPRLTQPAGDATGWAGEEVRRLGQRHYGPEHLLLGLLREGDNPAARLLRAHGLDLETVRAEVDRLIGQGVLPGPRPDDGELLATLGIDLAAVRRRLEESFGGEAVHQAATWVSHRPTGAVPHVPLGGTPLTCVRALRLAARQATARGQRLGPLHLLLGLLADAAEPAGSGLSPQERRLHAGLGLPAGGPHPLRRLVEARGATLEALRAAVLDELNAGR
jgi:hypothetical protein